ncbi:hypothetical protein Emed_000896 [Eimeria media]
MSGLKFIVLSAAALLFMEDGRALGKRVEVGFVNLQRETSAQNPVQSATVNHAGEEETRLPIIKDKDSSSTNTRRLPAALRSPPLDDSTSEGNKETEEKEFLDKVCKIILKEDSASVQEDDLKGTYMYAAQDSGEQQCAAAVEKWRGAIKDFPSTPPTYTANEPFYKEHKNVSVVGLYNPQSNPKVDCAIITCQSKASNDGSPEAAPGEGDPPLGSEADKPEELQPGKEPVLELPGARSDREDVGLVPGGVGTPEAGKPSTSETKSVYSLVCLSSPEALQNSEAPFS